MSRRASHQSEAIAGLLFEQPLNFELGFGGTSDRYPHIEDGFSLGGFAFEYRFDQRKGSTTQNSVDEKKIFEPIHMRNRNPSPLRNSRHRHFPAEFCAAASAKGKVGTSLTWVANQFRSHATLCAWTTRVPASVHIGIFAAWGRAA